MQLVEQHVVSKRDPRYAAIDAAAFASKNLYNQATYQMRQAFIHEGKYLSYAEVFHRVKRLECYQALPRKVSNSILILIDKNWRSFRKGLKAYDEQPEKFTGKPKIPGYKHKERGRNILIYDPIPSCEGRRSWVQQCAPKEACSLRSRESVTSLRQRE